jgi:hypothetical protein
MLETAPQLIRVDCCVSRRALRCQGQMERASRSASTAESRYVLRDTH